MNLKQRLKNLFVPSTEGRSDESLLRRMQETIDGYRKSGIQIGENCYVHGVLMVHGDPIAIGDECVLTYCTILGHDAAPALFLPELRGTGLLDRISVKKRTVIHDRCFIGVNATVLCGVEIGPDSIVGAGAVVTRSVPARVVVAGNPARVIATIDQFIARHRRGIMEYPEHYPRSERR